MIFVSLKSKLDGSVLVCDTPSKAVSALDELGMCSNQATLITFQGQGQRVPLLMYQGARYKSSIECYVELPFSEYADDFGQLFRDLLWKIFEPFVYKQYHTRVSHVTAESYPEGGDRCHLFHLFLMFKDESALASIAVELSEVADEEEVVEAKYFLLD